MNEVVDDQLAETVGAELLNETMKEDAAEIKIEYKKRRDEDPTLTPAQKADLLYLERCKEDLARYEREMEFWKMQANRMQEEVWRVEERLGI